jgi:membrane protein YdbS with pleckstrin-like domain
VDVEAAKRPSRTYGFLRAVSGVLAVGMVLLALVNIGVQFYANSRDLPGPGTLSVIAHVVAAVLAVAGQVVADRYADWKAPVASLAVLVVTGATLWTFWWA